MLRAALHLAHSRGGAGAEDQARDKRDLVSDRDAGQVQDVVRHRLHGLGAAGPASTACQRWRL